MNDFSGNSIMVERRTYKEPKRLADLAMMKLIHMLYERFFPRLLRSHSDIGGSDAIKEEVLVVSGWMYDTLNWAVAGDVQQLFWKSVMLLGNKIKYPVRFWRLLLLHPMCRSFSSEWFWDGFISCEWFWDSFITNMLKSSVNLEHLEWTHPHVDKLAENLKYCTRLKVFVCAEGCNDEIIKILSHNCPLLSVLNIKGSKSITDKSTHYIKNMKSLMRCSINKTSITIEGAVTILKSCTQLYQLDMTHDVPNILKDFEDADDHVKLPLRTVALVDHHITPHGIRLLKTYCPFLTNVRVSIGGASEPICPKLISVEQLKIKKLSCKGRSELNHPIFRWSVFNAWLMGDSINVICITNVSVSIEQLVELSDMCPNITELRLTFVRVISNRYVFSKRRLFQRLEILWFFNKTNDRTYTSNEQRSFYETNATIFKILLSYSRMIREISIMGLDIDDDVVDTVFKTNQMRYLQSWTLEESRCTSKTFFLLFHTCPMLKFIESLSTWNIHPDEVREIENFIQQGNYNLDTDTSGLIAHLESITNRAKSLLKRTPFAAAR